MYRIIILSSVLCGLTMGYHIPQGRILHSQNTSSTEHPYQVSVEFQKNHRCSGTIINEDYILTVASCLLGTEDDRSDFRIRAGAPYRGMVGEVRDDLSFTIHESFNNITFDYDIALIKLNTPFNFTAETDVNATIVVGTKVPEAGHFAIMTGWGARTSGTWLTQQLTETKMEIIYFNDCHYNYAQVGNEVTGNMICAGDPGTGGCQGDAGDPLVFNNELIGMMSWTFGCGERKYPSVFTNVTAFKDWIQQNTGI